MTHIAERAPEECPHPCLDDMFACTRCNSLERWRAAQARVDERGVGAGAAIEAVQNLFERAVQWMPWSLTTQDAADFGDELRADRDTAIRAIRVQA